MKTYNPENMADEQLKDLLAKSKTIAMIGLSPDTDTDSNKAGVFLKDKGYDIIPVTVHAHKILDEQCHHELNSIEKPVDIVYYFRHPDEVIQTATDEINRLALEAKSMGINTMWIHKGAECESAAKNAADLGLTVVEDASLPEVHAKVM
jgi:hypothetical protein